MHPRGHGGRGSLARLGVPRLSPDFRNAIRWQTPHSAREEPPAFRTHSGDVRRTQWIGCEGAVLGTCQRRVHVVADHEDLRHDVGAQPLTGVRRHGPAAWVCLCVGIGCVAQTRIEATQDVERGRGPAVVKVAAIGEVPAPLGRARLGGTRGRARAPRVGWLRARRAAFRRRVQAPDRVDVRKACRVMGSGAEGQIGVEEVELIPGVVKSRPLDPQVACDGALTRLDPRGVQQEIRNVRWRMLPAGSRTALARLKCRPGGPSALGSS